jgi:YbgC/YbaW family acyl-CoA thioester hydrolase
MLNDILTISISEKYIGSSGCVNRTHYLNLLMEAQNISLIKHKISFDDIEKKNNIHFVQRAFSIEFIKPLFLNDEVVIKISIPTLGLSSFVLKQEITKNNQIVTTAQTVYVAVDNSKNKILLPDSIRTLFSLKKG